LDAGAPHHGKFLCGRLGFDAEEEAEQIPVGFDSEKCFAEVDENGNIANGIRVEVMELNPVIIKEATKEGTSGEGQSPFGKMEECDDFVDILHGERFTERGAQLTRFFSCSNPSETSFSRLLREHLLCVHSVVDGSASFVLSSISDFLDAISDALATRCSGAAGRGARRSERKNLLGGKAAALGSEWGFWWLLMECRLKAWFFPTVIAGLNNQRGGEKSLF
jgi:hypothetical protein